ncbi:SAV0927 family protein [Cytobacillus oceanisediminis]|uniref:Protein dltD n=1 Tax=Cytobacillus oceanisediminis TaxID=665099 RepID=A0A562K1B4_9BACI|nr:SAV0927 family protein [Cytobacillus oceanisediminis]TWH89004.1 Protein of unknown function (DUF3055) [Cytobacillus oceanisediminis]
MNLDIISERNEKQSIHYFCILSNDHRYDLTIAYSGHFFGKAMVTSLQSGRMVLLCSEDIYNDYYWAPKLDIQQEDIPEFQDFFWQVLRSGLYLEQY